MKYLKLFEAFESIILSKTLSFIKDEESKRIFLGNLNRICDSIDYPKSELKDEYFQYLSFYPALKVSAKTGDESCDALSVNSFPEHGVEGEKCKEGKVVRKWGARRRVVTCPICNGTGVKPQKPEIKLIKFWFSSDGKYIASTAVDGQIRRNYRLKGNGFSKNYSDYKVIGTTEDSTTLTTGQIVKVTINGRPTICYIIKESSAWPFAIQDEHSGSTPDSTPGDQWRKFGRHSWQLSRNEYRGTIEILEPLNKVEDEAENEPDPYTWNADLVISRYSQIRTGNGDVQEIIKNANFAIILDFGKMKKSDFKTAQTTKGEREKARTGALALESPEDIKAANIERYIKQLADKITEGDELSKVTRIIPKIMGGNNAIIYLSRRRNLSTVENLATRLYRFMTEEDKEYYAGEIIISIKRSFKDNLKFVSDLNDTINYVKKELEKNNNTEHLKLFNEIMRVSAKINTKILQYKMESIDDIEYVYQKLLSISNLLNTSRNRAEYLRSFFERLEYLSDERAYQRLTEIKVEDIPEVIEGLKSIERFIER